MNFNIAEYVVSTLNILINCPIAAGINVFNPHSIIPNKKYIPYSIYIENIFTAKFYHSNSPCYFIEPFLSSAPTSLLHSILLKNKSYFYKQHTHHNILEKMNNLYILDPLRHHRKAILQIYL